jgi:SAM-dependent methyltransferase
LRKRWNETQKLMADEFQAKPQSPAWSLESDFATREGRGYVLNIGAGKGPIEADVNCDPLVPRDAVCVGEALPFRTGCFDSAIVFSVLDHVIDDVQVLKEAKRVLKQGGRLLLMQAIYGYGMLRYMVRHPRWSDEFHMRHYWTQFSLRFKLWRGGLRVASYVENTVGENLMSKVAFVVAESR